EQAQYITISSGRLKGCPRCCRPPDKTAAVGDGSPLSTSLAQELSKCRGIVSRRLNRARGKTHSLAAHVVGPPRGRAFFGQIRWDEFVCQRSVRQHPVGPGESFSVAPSKVVPTASGTRPGTAANPRPCLLRASEFEDEVCSIGIEMQASEIAQD